MAGEQVQKGLEELMEEEEEKKKGRMARGKAAFDRAAGQPFQEPGIAYAGNVAAQGMQNHAGAIQATNAAIDEEMESRVAQEREMRRMEHEKELMRLRLEARARRPKVTSFAHYSMDDNPLWFLFEERYDED